jgi:hypothetical protein
VCHVTKYSIVFDYKELVEMKSKFKHRRELAELAEKMGLDDKAHLTGQIKPGTKEDAYFVLVNNQRRFVKGLLRLPLEEQQARINYFKRVIAEQEAADATKVQE